MAKNEIIEEYEFPEYKAGELEEHAARLRGDKKSIEAAHLRGSVGSPFYKATDEEYILSHIIKTGCSEAEAWPKLEEIKRKQMIRLK